MGQGEKSESTITAMSLKAGNETKRPANTAIRESWTAYNFELRCPKREKKKGDPLKLGRR